MSSTLAMRRPAPPLLPSAFVYIPVEGSLVDRQVDACSGLVGYVNTDTDLFIGYMEGNRLGAANMYRYEERIIHAAGRLFTRYPTVAKFGIPACEMAANVIQVGTISRAYVVDFTSPGLALAYGARNGSTLTTRDGRSLVKTSAGLWYDGDRFLTRFEEEEGTFLVTESLPAS